MGRPSSTLFSFSGGLASWQALRNSENNISDNFSNGNVKKIDISKARDRIISDAFKRKKEIDGKRR